MGYYDRVFPSPRLASGRGGGVEVGGQTGMLDQECTESRHRLHALCLGAVREGGPLPTEYHCSLDCDVWHVVHPLSTRSYRATLFGWLLQ